MTSRASRNVSRPHSSGPSIWRSKSPDWFKPSRHSREEQTRQEALMPGIGGEVDGIKAELVAAQEAQAQEMGRAACGGGISHRGAAEFVRLARPTDDGGSAQGGGEGASLDDREYAQPAPTKSTRCRCWRPATDELPVAGGEAPPVSVFDSWRRRSCGSRFTKSASGWIGWVRSTWRRSTSIVSSKSGISF